MKSCFRIFLFAIVLITFSSCLSTNSSIQQEKEILKQEYVMLSDAYFNLNRFSDSLDMLFKAQDISNDNSLDYKIARTAAFDKKWSISIEYYNKILLKDPNNLTIKKSLAWVLAQSGDLENSKSLYNNLYTEFSFDKEIAKNYILVLIAGADIESAQVILDEYSTMYPDDDSIESLQEKIINYK